MTKKISFMSLMILIIAAIDNIRNLPTAALFGSSLIFFFTLSALIFLIPTALISAELSAAFPENGGIYQWVRLAFGKRLAMAAIWLQWVNTMIWYPTMLSFIAGAFAYLINPDLANNKLYLVTTILAIFWGLTLINMRGLQVSAILNNIFCIFGTMLPLILLIALGGVWIAKGNPIQISFDFNSFIPPLDNTTSWSSLIAIMASFLGIELAGVHVNDIDNPQRNFPRAVLLASVFIFATMCLGSLSIAFVLPNQEINLISGVMQLYSSFFVAFGLEPLIPVITLLIVIGSAGNMINWIISPAKGLLHASEFGFLPPFLAKKNENGVASNILLAQALIVSLVSLLFLFEPNINGFYWFLTALSTELYMCMYVLMFVTALRLHYQHTNREGSFKIPGKAFGIWATCLLGFTGCITTIIVSFFPPENVQVGTPLRYFLMIAAGNVLAITPLAFFYLYERKTRVLLPTQN